jgi:ADP-heptose:LPS heptosyltransferase
LLEQCLAGTAPDRLPALLLEEQCAPALFGTWVEGLADRFEPRLCEIYARLFAEAVAHLDPSLQPHMLVERYGRVRRPRPVSENPRRVYVLSRVTLGADVAVTSVLLAGVKERFPSAELYFVGPRKNYELFAADPLVLPAFLDYRRGSLADRLAAAAELKELLREPGTLVLDSDSRLTQLGLIPVCEEDRYHLFESRAFGGATDRPLPELAAEWVQQTLGVAGAEPFVALEPRPEAGSQIAVSLGVGENESKRLPDPFEEQLLRLLAETGLSIGIDMGAGGAEAERVRCAAARSGVPAQFWNGSFAGFANWIAGSRLYVGYDSAGQHVAAACGVPLISVFAGFPCPRMFARWRPIGAQTKVIRVDRPDTKETLARVREALKAYV